MLFSRDTLPPLVLVVLIRYSKTDSKPACCASLQGGTRPLVWVGSGMASFTQRRTTDAAHHPRSMTYTAAQVATLMNTIMEQSQSQSVSQPAPVLDPIDAKIKAETDVKVAEKMALVQQKIEQIALVNATFQVILEETLGSAAAELIVKMLDKSRISNNDFHRFIGAYTLPGIKDDLHKRNLIRVVSAIYRLKVKDLSKSQQSSLRSIVKYSTACPHCGAIAYNLVQRLGIQGLI